MTTRCSSVRRCLQAPADRSLKGWILLQIYRYFFTLDFRTGLKTRNISLLAWCKLYLCQTDPTRNLVRDVFTVDVSHPGARDVLHPSTAHPHLQRHTETKRVTSVSVWKSDFHRKSQRRTAKVRFQLQSFLWKKKMRFLFPIMHQGLII